MTSFEYELLENSIYIIINNQYEFQVVPTVGMFYLGNLDEQGYRYADIRMTENTYVYNGYITKQLSIEKLPTRLLGIYTEEYLHTLLIENSNYQMQNWKLSSTNEYYWRHNLRLGNEIMEITYTVENVNEQYPTPIDVQIQYVPF